MEFRYKHLKQKKEYLGKNPSSNITFNGEKIDTFSLQKARKECFLTLFSIDHHTRSHIQCNKTRKTNKKVYKLENKKQMFFFTDDIIIYVENPKEFTKKGVGN